MNITLVNIQTELNAFGHPTSERAMKNKAGLIDVATVNTVIAPGIGRQRQSELVVRSDLLGMTLDLPEPYNKKADQPWPLSVSLPIASKQQMAVFKVAGMAELHMDFDNRKMQLASHRRCFARW